MNKEALGTLLAVLTAVISGVSIPLNKIFVVNLDPTLFTALRSLIIGIIFLFIISRQNFNLKKFKKLQWKYLLAIALVGGATAFLLFFSGLKLTTAGRAAFLQKTLPLYVLVLAFIFLKEKIRQKQLFAILLMFFRDDSPLLHSDKPGRIVGQPVYRRPAGHRRSLPLGS